MLEVDAAPVAQVGVLVALFGVDLDYCTHGQRSVVSMVPDGEVHQDWDSKGLEVLLQHTVHSEAGILGHLVLFTVVVARELTEHRSLQGLQLACEL